MPVGVLLPSTRLLVASALALATVVLVACGNGRLGTQEYLARGDRLCDNVTLTANRFGRPPTLNLLPPKIRAVDAALTRVTTELRRLRAPRALEPAARTYLGLVDRRVRVDRQLIAAVKIGDKNPIILLGVRANVLDVKLDAAAARVGFQSCVTPGY